MRASPFGRINVNRLGRRLGKPTSIQRLARFIVLVCALAAQSAHATSLELAKLDVDSFSKSQMEKLDKEIKHIAYWDRYAEFCGVQLDFVRRARAVASPCLTEKAMDAINQRYDAAAAYAHGEIVRTIGTPNPAFCSLPNPSTKRPYLSEAKELIEGRLSTMNVMCRACVWCGKD